MLADHPIHVVLLATDLGVAKEFHGDRVGLISSDFPETLSALVE